MSDIPIPRLIAHRGHASRYPENTWLGIEAALHAGVPALEFDVQLSSDGVPFVIHDATLRRTADTPGRVTDMRCAELRGVSVGESRRFGERFAHARIPLLEELVERLRDWPQVTLFCEIKPESAPLFAVDETVEKVVRLLEPVAEHCVLISFIERAVLAARRFGLAAGWCLAYYDDDAHRLAGTLAPEYLLANHRIIPPAPQKLWQGGWQWALWEIVDPARALALAAQGADFIETMACAEMYAHPLLAEQRIETLR